METKRRRRIKRVKKAPHGPRLPYNGLQEVPKGFQGPFIMCNGYMRLRADGTGLRTATEADR